MRLIQFCIICFSGMIFMSCQKPITLDEQTGTIKITIKHTVKGVPLVLNTGTYTNPFGEQYSISKLKYYLSNVSVTGTAINPVNADYYLIDESKPASLSFSFEAPVNTYTAINFLLGVDSARNVSGAQTGALDPLNDMFWTWNTGYIMAKMEGNSPQSPVVNNKVEYHIGGFTGPNSVLSYRGFLFSALGHLEIRAGKTSEIFMEADIDKWWQGTYDLKIADNPVVTTPGALAKSISDNYAGMLKIVDIKNY
jgi:hypothetical protein